MKIGLSATDRWDNEVYYYYSFDQWFNAFINHGFENGLEKNQFYGIEKKVERLTEMIRELANVLSPAQKKQFVESVGQNGECVVREDNE